MTDAALTDCSSTTAELFDSIADALIEKGFIIGADMLPVTLIEDLCTRARQLNDYHVAAIGRQNNQHIAPSIRRDRIHWLEPGTPVEADYLQWMNTLKTELNRRLFMGLFDYEAHFAHYPSGAFYGRHYDAFEGRTNRVLTTVLYLNHDWKDSDGGEMMFYPQDSALKAKVPPLLTVTPHKGTLAIFLSRYFPHQVARTQRDRYSIAGWFRINGSIGNQIDPPR